MPIWACSFFVITVKSLKSRPLQQDIVLQKGKNQYLVSNDKLLSHQQR